MNKKYIVACMFSVLLLGACSDEQIMQDMPEAPQHGVVVNTPEGANGGELLIKFRPEVTAALDKAQTRSIGSFAAMTRSGIADIDRALDIIGSYHIERVFPINNKEELTRKSGLHLWYVVKFDENTDVQRAAQELAQVGEIAKIQYSHQIKRQEVRQPVAVSPAERKAMFPVGQSNAFFNDEGLAKQWHYINTGNQDAVVYSKAGSDVNLGEAWKKCTGDPSVIVAVMDEGVMWSHPDLEANMWVNEGEVYKSDKDHDGNGYAGDVYGYNFAENAPGISWTGRGDTGHGTHVAGTVAAVNNNGVGVCGVAGGSGNNDGVKLMSIQIFSGEFGVNPYNEARGIKYAADNGAVILQCSWGYQSSMADPSTTQRGFATDEQWIENCPLEKEAFDYFIHNAGSPNGVIDGGLVIFASGNEYAAAAGYPGAFGDFISVVATDAAFMPASYSNYGPGCDISAPGGDSDYHLGEAGSVYSTLPPNHSKGIGYGYMDGTSMACPHVSGVAALGLSYAAKQHKHFKASEFKQMILNSTRDLHSLWTSNKLYYKYYSLAGESTPVLMELNKYYKGQVGSGLIDADMLLAQVDAGGVKLGIPNMYVEVGADKRQFIDLTRFFDGGENLTFTVESADNAIAEVSIVGSTMTVTGITVGTTTYTVKASDGTSQTAAITVRRNANDNGWL